MIMADTPFYMKRESEALLPSDSLLAGDDILPSNSEYTLPYLKTDIPLAPSVIEPYYYHWIDTPFYQSSDINDGLPYLLSDIFLESHKYDDGPDAAIINNNILQLMLMFNPNIINVKGV